MTQQRDTNRRTVLKTLGAGIAGGAVLTGSAGAKKGGKKKKGGKGNNYGNGNAIGAFLNEEAENKPSPVWDSGIADKTGQKEEVDVLWSGLTDVIGPKGNIVQAPWGIDPRVVKISPGTTVTWTWFDEMWGEDLPGGPFPPLDIHHLVSYFDPPYEEEFEFPPELFSESQDEEDGEDDHNHEHPGGEDEFYLRKDPGESFSHTFDEVGTYFYFCIPHGVPSGELGGFPNLFGQRGAVKVVGD